MGKKPHHPVQENENKWQGFSEDDLEDSVEASENDELKSLEHPSYIELENKLTAAEQKAQENLNVALRAQAEVENIKRRAERDIANAHKYSVEKIIREIIPIKDSLEQGLEVMGTGDNEQMQKGIILTLQMFKQALEKFALSEIDPQGENFDPNFHEAMAMQESQELGANKILKVLQKGYKLHDRVIRPARVIVSKG